MSNFISLPRSAPLLWILAFLSLFNVAVAGLGLIPRHNGGAGPPKYLQSHWHTEHLPPSNMTAEQAMAYYFPKIWSQLSGADCSPANGTGNGTGNGAGNGTGNGGGGGDGGGGNTTAPVNYALRNYNTISGVYNLTVYPKNLPLFLNDTSIGYPFFNQNVTGRVTPLGNFSGYDDNIEYFWGLAPVPSNASSVAITNAVVSHFTSGCPEVAASSVELTVMNVVGPENGTFVTKLKEIAFWRFDDSGLISAYDAWIPNLNDFVEKINNPSVGIYAGGNFVPSEAEQLGTIENICQLESIFCTGGNSQYSNITDCIGTLRAKPYGTFDETWGDNVPCRRVHSLLLPIRPEVHCPHVGPNGGGKCTDIDYNEVYFDDVDLFGSATLFNCPLASF